jgi:hypothetical protein
LLQHTGWSLKWSTSSNVQLDALPANITTLRPAEFLPVRVQDILRNVRFCVEMNTSALDEDKPNALLEPDTLADDEILIDPTIVANGVQVRSPL